MTPEEPVTPEERRADGTGRRELLEVREPTRYIGKCDAACHRTCPGLLCIKCRRLVSGRTIKGKPPAKLADPIVVGSAASRVDVERLRRALHEAGIGCKPNVPYCRATHRGHAERIAEKYNAEPRP